MRALIGLTVIIYLVGVGVALSPTIRANMAGTGLPQHGPQRLTREGPDPSSCRHTTSASTTTQTTNRGLARKLAGNLLRSRGFFRK